jgi:CRP-like cAMP-binding protein
MRRTATELRETLHTLAERLHHLFPLSEREHRAVIGLWREVTEINFRAVLPPPREIGFVVSGWACLQRRRPDGRRQIIRFLAPGESHDSRAMTHAEPITAACLTHVQFVDASSLFEGSAARDYPALAEIRTACERRTRDCLISQIVRLSVCDSRSALAHLTLELERRVAPGEFEAQDSTSFALPLGQRALGHALGFSTVHVNKTLAKLREEGVLELREGRAHILDRARLKALAHA